MIVFFAGTWTLLAWGYYRASRASAAPLSNITTWQDVRVLEKIDDIHYIMWQPPNPKKGIAGWSHQALVAFCWDSAKDLNLDPGMMLESLTFEQRPECKTVHDWRLGFYVYRHPDGTFIDWRL